MPFCHSYCKMLKFSVKFFFSLLCDLGTRVEEQLVYWMPRDCFCDFFFFFFACCIVLMQDFFYRIPLKPNWCSLVCPEVARIIQHFISFKCDCVFILSLKLTFCWSFNRLSVDDIEINFIYWNFSHLFGGS